MKKFKIYLIAALGLAMFQEVSAQPERQRGMTQTSGKEILYRQVDDLTDEQKEQIDAIYNNLKSENKALMEQVKENNEEARASVRALLTEDQLDQLADAAMNRSRMHRGSGRMQGKQRMQQRQFDPKAMASREKDALYEHITDLTDDQKSVIDEIYTQYAADLSKAFEDADGDREKMRSQMREVRSGKQELLKEILTEEQWVKAEELANKARERRRGNRPPQK